MQFQFHLSILVNKTQSIVRNYSYDKKNYKYNCDYLRCVGLLCNSQACLATSLAVLSMLCNVLGMLTTSLADLGMLLQDPRSPTSKRNPSTCCLISCETKGVVYHQVSYLEAQWYTIPLTSQFIKQQVGGFLFDVRLLEPCKSMPRSARDVAKHAQDVAKTCLGRCKACRGQPKTLPSMPWTLQACLHILSIHNKGINVGSQLDQ